MHGGVHPREVRAPYWPRVARDGVRKKQLLDHDIIRLAGCVPQPPDSVPLHMVSHVGLASAGQQLSRGGAMKQPTPIRRTSMGEPGFAPGIDG